MAFKTFFMNSIPFGMVFGTLCMIAASGLSGLGNNVVGPVFSVDTKDFSMPTSTFTSLTSLNDISNENTPISNSNVSSASIPLADKYSFYIWSYAATTGSETNYSKSDFNYIDNLNISTAIATDGTVVNVPGPFLDLQRKLKDELLVAQAVFIAALLNAGVLLIIGIAACVNIKTRLMVIYFFHGITLLTVIILAAVVTAIAVSTASDAHFKGFGADGKIGTSMVVVLWLAVVHMLVVCCMWLLMGLGKMQMNRAVSPRVSKEQIELRSQISR